MTITTHTATDKLSNEDTWKLFETMYAESEELITDANISPVELARMDSIIAKLDDEDLRFFDHLSDQPYNEDIIFERKVSAELNRRFLAK